MLIPSIDLQDGETVQLIGGRTLALRAGDPRSWAELFGRLGEVAVIDLDAAMNSGSNAEDIRQLLRVARCRVGGGIRDVATARRWLHDGAAKVILGTAATPEIVRQLPRDRVIVALDAVHGEVVVDGWQTRTGVSVLQRLAELRDHVSGVLLTFVEREGRMTGIDEATVKAYVEAAGQARVTIAGGIKTAEDIATLDRLGCDAQVGMAIYRGDLGLADAFAAPLRSDRPDGLWPTVVTDVEGPVLGLVYSSLDSLREAIRLGKGVYQSRRRGVWVKGRSSGATQELIRIDVDCDRDALRFVVRQSEPGFCHQPQWSCFGRAHGVAELQQTLLQRQRSPAAESYSNRLLQDPALLADKLQEEARELAEARIDEEVIHEAADLLYFTLARIRQAGVRWSEVERELDRRGLRIFRRGGESKKAGPTS